MRFIVPLSLLFALALAGTSAAETASVDFCIDLDTDGLCDQEFTTAVELDGLTDMDLLEIALEDELILDNWDDYLWAISIQGHDYDLLPQFDGAYEAYLVDGDEVYIWFTGWQWHSSCTGNETLAAA